MAKLSAPPGADGSGQIEDLDFAAFAVGSFAFGETSFAKGKAASKPAKSARAHVEKFTRQVTTSNNQRFFNDSFFREGARGKLAELLIGGKVLRFSGGSYPQQRADMQARQFSVKLPRSKQYAYTSWR